MPFEIITYLDSNKSPDELLDELCLDARFEKKNLDALGIGAIVEADLPGDEEASDIHDQLGFTATAYLRYILLSDAPLDAITDLTMVSAQLLVDQKIDGAIVFPMGDVILVYTNGLASLSSGRSDLQDPLQTAFGQPLEIRELPTL